MRITWYLGNLELPAFPETFGCATARAVPPEAGGSSARRRACGCCRSPKGARSTRWRARAPSARAARWTLSSRAGGL